MEGVGGGAEESGGALGNALEGDGLVVVVDPGGRGEFDGVGGFWGGGVVFVDGFVARKNKRGW